MPNLKGGKKYKRQKKNDEDEKRILRYKTDINEEYGIISKVLGSCRFMIKCSDGKERIGLLRSGIKKGGYINKDDWVLVGLRSYDTIDNKCDILYKYFPDEINVLKKKGHITDTTTDYLKSKDDVEVVDENMAFNFEDI